MTRRDDLLDAMVRYLGAAYYEALHGGGTAADVSKAVAQVAEVAANQVPGSPSAGEEAPRGAWRTGRWRVSDVMTSDVVCVPPRTSYKQVAQVLREHHVSALPVLTPEGRVAGVVSEADLLWKEEDREHAGPEVGRKLHGSARGKAAARIAAQLMTAPAVTIGPEALLATAARVMTAHHIKRLPVVAPDGRLIGIVTRGDLLKTFVRPDAELAAEASAVLTDVLLADPGTVQVSVRKGVVTLEGRLDSEKLISAARRLTETIDGVVAVTSNLTAPPPEGFPGGGYHIPA